MLLCKAYCFVADNNTVRQGCTMYTYMFFDLFFPSKCVGCGKFGKSICSLCEKNIQPIQKDVCPACFYPSKLGFAHDRCKTHTYLDGALALTQYKGVMRKIIKEAKYRLAYKIITDFLSVVPPHWYEKFKSTQILFPNMVLCPVPLHRERYNRRGFNQAEIIAKGLGKRLNIHTETILQRIKNTTPQAQQKSRAQRKLNIMNAFTAAATTKIQNKVVVLVDDLFTSGSTANEAARVLKENGADRVFLFTLAHG
ncbi:hypothetical protein CO051_05170 [Candidatus Roizmanbacteria bacterium CG_4_9_14_0_2_um_filter_39_13]|uniref:Phosphoribosyltransferase domain-containing protein n=2 Tax=Candidatus Roizmaniibacteriota TaxID=1752723 RepID=A0A2M8EXE7_9BACT|nr:MAG: hypothetical protein COY15_05855 [Candidatus Roizmanbacteria bacterium CG_4_10_14_0_2_um_filter_39_12]PJC30643.1 MAG: hypothetical protein CO051_05170 [Candidatus Roizmanbacteria bacterium CG_4_9_14_0_2_um_filter_39_13]PJE62308.1 MAG: hypothetical protein COU87_00060 [Candidatus Roizmanbacteria bacterium CG10_big_fil_rev_8_21_14_0_10_39_12]